MKVKFISQTLVWILGLIPLVSFSVDVDEYLNGDLPFELPESPGGADAADPAKIIQPDITGEDGVVKQLLDSLWFTVEGADPAVQFVVNIINYLLALIGLIALGILIYGFYKMFFSKSDEAWDGAKKIVINTIIALFVIGFARYITWFLFNLFFATSGGI